MTSAVRALKSCGVVHCDVKPDNFLCGFGKGQFEVKLGDFGLACESGAGVGRGVVGTPPFIAPEVAMRGDVSFESDAWSLGMCVFAVAAEAFLVEDLDEVRAISEVQVAVQVVELDVEEEVKDSIVGLLRVAPEKRSLPRWGSDQTYTDPKDMGVPPLFRSR